MTIALTRTKAGPRQAVIAKTSENIAAFLVAITEDNPSSDEIAGGLTAIARAVSRLGAGVFVAAICRLQADFEPPTAEKKSR